MKKIIIVITIVVCALLLCAFAIWLFAGDQLFTKLTVPEETNDVTLICANHDSGIDLSHQDAHRIIELINDHSLFSDGLSCGFSENASLILHVESENMRLMLASDGCPYLLSEKHNQFIRLSDEEITELHDILIRYDLRFPCV